ncbi:MAG: hypothetical protein ABI346_04355 [Candidatus Baltobacteraceae bacterium]
MNALCVGAVATLLIAISTGLRSTPYNNYVLLAEAVLHGHLWIEWPGSAIDALKFGGRYYVIEAPVPALFLLPLVAAFGTHANQTLLATLFGGVAVGAAWQIGTRLEVPTSARVLLVAFFMIGTDLWWCSMYGDVWFIAHSSAVCFTMLALAEVLGKRRAWIVALCGGLAAGSRFNLVAALPVYAYLLSRERSTGDLRKVALAFCAVLVPFALAWVAYNLARWGVPNDIGYATWYHQDQIGDPTGPPFKLKYLPIELYSFFVLPPLFARHFPYISTTNAGLALTWTSPALVFAFFARRPRAVVGAMWAAVALLAIPNLVYYAQGATQFGMRHALDFEPFLLVLMMLAARTGLPVWANVLCAYSIAVGVWGLWFWRTFWRPLY